LKFITEQFFPENKERRACWAADACSYASVLLLL